MLTSYEVGHRSQPHDFLIRGPFSDGSSERRLVNCLLRATNRFFGRGQTVRVHVSSENPFSENYQGFGHSDCDFGLAREIRNGDPSYQRMPH